MKVCEPVRILVEKSQPSLHWNLKAVRGDRRGQCVSNHVKPALFLRATSASQFLNMCLGLNEKMLEPRAHFQTPYGVPVGEVSGLRPELGISRFEIRRWTDKIDAFLLSVGLVLSIEGEVEPVNDASADCLFHFCV